MARLPVHYIFPNFEFDAVKFYQEIQKLIPNLDEEFVIFHSTGLFYRLGW